MAYELTVQQNQLVHTATFSRPVLELWGEGGAIIDGILRALGPFGVRLADIRNESPSQNPADQIVTATIGLRGIFRFRFDKLESTFFNFVDEDLLQIPKILEAGTSWVQKAVPTATISNHQVVYSSHGTLKGKSVKDFLGFSKVSAKSGGINNGSGVIFHWLLPEREWETQFLIDRSLLIPDGLFLMFSLSSKKEIQNYSTFASEVQSYLGGIIEEVDLKFS